MHTNAISILRPFSNALTSPISVFQLMSMHSALCGRAESMATRGTDLPPTPGSACLSRLAASLRINPYEAGPVDGGWRCAFDAL